MAELPVLSDEQLSAALNLAEIMYDIPEWGAAVKLKAFSLDERDIVLSACTEKDGKIDGKKLIRLLVIHGVVAPKITEELIGKMSFSIVERIAEQIMKLNGMQKEKGASPATVADVTF